MRFTLAAGQFYVKTEARAGAKALAVSAPSRFVVMPDFFADDIVVDATQIPIDNAELPSENFLIHLLPDQNAIVMTVADSREQDARVTLSGKDAERLINRSEVYYGSGKVWVAVLEAPGIWHQRDIARDETNKIIPLDWTRSLSGPMARGLAGVRQADQQLGDDHRACRAADSSGPPCGAMAAASFPATGRSGPPCSARTTIPAGSTCNSQGYFQPMMKGVRFEGPAVIYPINRLKTTPLDQFTVVDVVRGHARRRALPVHSRRRRARGRPARARPPAPPATCCRPSTSRTSRSRAGPGSRRRSTMS